MPGRFTPPIPERLAPQCAMSALTSVPEAMPRGRMHDEMRRLVDDDEVVVLVGNRKRNCSGAGAAGSGSGTRTAKDFARFDPMAAVSYGRAGAIRDVAATNERLHVGAAQRPDVLRQHLVEARRRILGRDFDADRDLRSRLFASWRHGLRDSQTERTSMQASNGVVAAAPAQRIGRRPGLLPSPTCACSASLKFVVVGLALASVCRI